jgi:quinol monooxygenase YgiN/limonene-1,2-epoxide hydrolase
VLEWVDAFNRRDVDALAALYAEDAVNHQVMDAPVTGRAAIRAMFAAGFAAAEMVCIVEAVYEDGEWAILEWRDPLGLRGCGFFHVVGDRIVFQRGYWDKATFLRQHGLKPDGEAGVDVDPIVVLIEYRMLAGAEARARHQIDALVATVVASEPDCLGITVLQDHDDPARLLLHERWTSREAYLGPHMQTPHLRAFIAGAAELFAGPPAISFWRAGAAC